MARNPNIDDDTRARARRFVEDADMPKPAVTAKPNLPKKAPIVTKKMLADSGFDNLRDYLNDKRGLKRREGKPMSMADAAKQLKLGEKPSTQEVSDAKLQLGLEEPMRAPRRTPESLSATRKPGTSVNYENTDESPSMMKRGGKVKSASRRGDGIAIRGKTRA